MDPRGKKEERLVKEQHGGELKDMKLTRGEMERMAKNREEGKSLVPDLCVPGATRTR